MGDATKNGAAKAGATVHDLDAAAAIAKRTLEDAQQAIARAEAARDRELERVAAAREERDELRQRLEAADGGDAKAIARIGAELAGKQTVLDVLENRVPPAEAAVQQARAAENRARREIARIENTARLEQLAAELARLEEEIEDGTRVFVERSRELLRRQTATWSEAWNLAFDLGVARLEPLRRWPDADARDGALLEALGARIQPPLPDVHAGTRERERVAQAAREEQRVRELMRRAGPSTPRPLVGNSGLNEHELVRLADQGGGPPSSGPKLVPREEIEGARRERAARDAQHDPKHEATWPKERR